MADRQVAANQPASMDASTVGDGIHDVFRWAIYSEEGGKPVSMYRDQDVSITVWNLLPGQEHSAHLHPERAHIMVVVCGSGVALIGEEKKRVPLKQGDYYIAPRDVVHGILNTGTERLSYATLSNNNQVRNQAVPVGEQQQPSLRSV